MRAVIAFNNFAIVIQFMLYKKKYIDDAIYFGIGIARTADTCSRPRILL